MTESALVRNIQTLTDLDDALGRFATGAEEALRTADREIARAQEWAQQRVWHWQRQLQQAQQTLRQAQDALNFCRSQVYVDRDGRRHEPDCRDQERAVHDAEHMLREVEIQLRKAQKGRAQLESAVNEYRRFAGRLQHLAGSHTHRARASLKQTRADLERYLAVAPSTGTPSAEIPILSPLAEAFVGLIPGADGHAETTGPNQAESVRKDQGIQTVRVEDLPDPEGISSERDFKRWPADRMRDGLVVLQEMMPIISSGEGNSSEYWAEVDHAQGLSYESPDSRQRIYEVFYGQRAVKVVWDGSRYEIDHGHHRIWLAKRMGIETLPVHLIERQVPS